jgi:hypothetical protein
MRKKKGILLIVVTLIASVTFRCGQGLSGVETTNGATVTVQADRVEGTTPPFANIYLFDKDYIPYIDEGLGVATAADGNGRFLFNGIRGETFTVAVVCDEDSRSILLCAGCTGSTISSPLYNPGKLEGSVTASDTGSILIFLHGTGWYKILKNSGSFVFDALPQGKYRLQAAILSYGESGKPSIKNLSTPKEIEVASGKIVTTEPVLLP